MAAAGDPVGRRRLRDCEDSFTTRKTRISEKKKGGREERFHRRRRFAANALHGRTRGSVHVAELLQQKLCHPSLEIGARQARRRRSCGIRGALPPIDRGALRFAEALEPVRHRFPVNRRMTTTIKRSPTRPLGRYPQPRLYGQAGTAPRRSTISRIKRIRPMMFLLSGTNHAGPFAECMPAPSQRPTRVPNGTVVAPSPSGQVRSFDARGMHGKPREQGWRREQGVCLSGFDRGAANAEAAAGKPGEHRSPAHGWLCNRFGIERRLSSKSELECGKCRRSTQRRIVPSRSSQSRRRRRIVREDRRGRLKTGCP